MNQMLLKKERFFMAERLNVIYELFTAKYVMAVVIMKIRRN